jgi:hypothetical protein
MRAWLAVSLLAGSWLLGLGYLDPVQPMAWFCTLVAAVLLLASTPLRLPGLSHRLLVLPLLLGAVWWVPFPYVGLVVLLLLGVAASVVAVPAPLLRRFSRASLLASAILLPQSLILLFYQTQTARGHELPAMAVKIMAALLRLLGADATADMATLVVRSASTAIRVAATWELLLDPATVCFVAGGGVLLALRRQAGGGPSFRAWGRQMLALIVMWAVWAPLRAALLITLVLQQRLRATPVTWHNVGETFVSTWVHIVLVLVFALLVAWLIPRWMSAAARPAHRESRAASPTPARQWLAGSLCALAVAMLTFLYFWAPVGQRQGGRIKIVERHSTWEPTTHPYDTELYGEEGSYNYAAAYAFCGQYYQMSRLLEEDTIDATTLADCDVLIIKTPTSRYAEAEVQAVVDFVERGGALLVIGDHTNVFNMCTYLNDITRHFGFSFRNDLLFRIGSPYRQDFRPPRVCHPTLQYMPPMTFAVSCSIDPGSSGGTMALRNCGLFNLPPAYQESNYHPQAEYRPYAQYGSWCQLWATTHGRGRVLAFADSTLFSNFCLYQPGKAELLLGMVEWLNHRSWWDLPGRHGAARALLAVVSVGMLLASCWLVRGMVASWLVLFAVAVAAWAAGSSLVAQLHHRSMPAPAAHDPLLHVVIDRTISHVPLFTGAFPDDPDGNGYGMLEQWIPRVGNRISRRAGNAAFEGQAMVMICPTMLPAQSYRDQLVDWVRNGGHLLVFDTPDLSNSTANSVLMLFGLASSPGTPPTAEDDQVVQLVDGSATTGLAMSCVISGGTPLATWGDAPVAARVVVGQGSVTAVGFGSLFNDSNMGYHWLAEPDEQMLQRYELLYGLLRQGLMD